AVGAHVIGASIAVHGYVRVLVHRLDVARAVALIHFAVAGRLRARRRPRRRVVEAAGAGHAAAARVALGVHPGALPRAVALHARAGAVAHDAAGLAAGSVGRLAQVRRRAVHAGLDRALEAVVQRQVGVVRRADDAARAVALALLT